MSRFYEIADEKLPSVTSICQLLSKPGLYRFYAKEGWEKANKIAHAAANVGTDVHTYINQVFNKTLPGLVPAPLRKNKGYRTAHRNFNKFYEIFEPKPILIEQIVYSPIMKFAGTMDALLRVGDANVLVDWKTSSSVYPEYELQLNAYWAALTEMRACGIVKYEGKIDELWVVRLDKEKEFKEKKDVKRYKQDDLTLKAFLGLLDVFKWKNKGRQDK